MKQPSRRQEQFIIKPPLKNPAYINFIIQVKIYFPKTYFFKKSTFVGLKHLNKKKIRLNKHKGKETETMKLKKNNRIIMFPQEIYK